MYTAPPDGDGENRTRPKLDGVAETIDDDATEDESEIDAEAESHAAAEHGSPTVESTSATTDANWTGTVPADD